MTDNKTNEKSYLYEIFKTSPLFNEIMEVNFNNKEEVYDIETRIISKSRMLNVIFDMNENLLRTTVTNIKKNYLDKLKKLLDRLYNFKFFDEDQLLFVSTLKYRDSFNKNIEYYNVKREISSKELVELLTDFQVKFTEYILKNLS